MKVRSKKLEDKVTSLSELNFIPEFGKTGRRRLNISALVAGNILLLIAIASFLIINHSASQTVRNSVTSSVIATSDTSASPLDQISSAQIALAAARAVNLPEVTSVSNTADSQSLLLANVPNDSTILDAPQVVSTAEKSRYQIVFYKVKPGDTSSSIAQKYNLTLSSVTSSNNLNGNYVTPGSVLAIPPANGVVHQVAAGETVDSIVSAYDASRSLFIAVNDAENGVRPGEYVWIPNAVPVQTASTGPSFGAFAFGSSPDYGYNGYDFGTCTWYVASQISVPANWGNADTWDLGALASGWVVSLHPRVGSIAQNSWMAGGLGHVAIVTAVNGSQIQIRDMNDPYWDVVTTHWMPASTFQHYIYK